MDGLIDADATVPMKENCDCKLEIKGGVGCFFFLLGGGGGASDQRAMRSPLKKLYRGLQCGSAAFEYYFKCVCVSVSVYIHIYANLSV